MIKIKLLPLQRCIFEIYIPLPSQIETKLDVVYSKSGERLKDDLGIAVGVVGFLGLVYASNHFIIIKSLLIDFVGL